MNDIICTTLEEELSSLLKLDYIPTENKNAFKELVTTFSNRDDLSDSDIYWLMNRFNILMVATLKNIDNNTNQKEACVHMCLLKSTFLIATNRPRDGFTRRAKTITLN